MNLFELAAKITLDSKEYESGIKKASESGGKFANALQTAGKTAKVAFSAIATAVGTATVAIAAGVTKTAEYADNIDKMSQKLGLSAEAYQEWDFIAQHSGTNIDGLQASMKTLANAAQGGNEAFKKLGLSLEDVQGMSQEDLFSTVISRLQDMGESTERTAIASDLLGRSATELAPLLNTSAEATEEMRNQAHELGAVMSDDAVKAGAAFQDSLQNLKAAFSGLQNNLLGSFMPAITSVMDGITALVTGDGHGIDLINKGVGEFLQKLIDSIPKVADAAISMIESFLGVIIDNLPQIIESGIKIVIKLAEGLLKAIPKLVANIPQIIKAIVKGFAEALPEFLEVGKNIVSGVWQGIKNMGGWLRDKVFGFFSSIVSGVKSVLGIHSPSKVFAGIGKYMAQGVGVGWEYEFDGIQKDINNSLDFDGSASFGVVGSATAANYGATSNSVSFGNITFNINGADYANVNELADAVSERLQTLADRRVAVWA